MDWIGKNRDIGDGLRQRWIRVYLPGKVGACIARCAARSLVLDSWQHLTFAKSCTICAVVASCAPSYHCMVVPYSTTQGRALVLRTLCAARSCA